MKKILFFIAFLSTGIAMAQESQIAVQSAHVGHINKAQVDHEQKLMVTLGSFNDKSIKFWNLTTGVLLKTISFDQEVKNFFIDAPNAKTYLGTSDGITVYDNKTLEEIKKLPIDSLNQFVLDEGFQLLYAQTGNEGAYTFKIIDPNSGRSELGPAWPSQGKALYGRLQGNGRYFAFETEFLESVFFDPESKQFGMFKGTDHVAVFPNGNFLYIDVLDETHVKVVRYDGVQQKNIWEKTLVIEKDDKASSVGKGQVTLTPDGKGLWVAPGTSTLIELNPENGAVKGVIYSKTKKTQIISDNQYVYALERTSDKLSAPGYYRKYKRYSTYPEAQYGYPVLNPDVVAMQHNNATWNLVAQNLEGATASMLASSQTTQSVFYDTTFEGSYISSNAIFQNPTTNEAFLAMNPETGMYKVKIGDSKSMKSLVKPANYGYNVSVDALQRIAVVPFKNSFRIIDLNTKSEIASRIHKNVKNVSQQRVTIHPKEKKLLFVISDEIIFDQQYDWRIDYYDVAGDKVLWSKKGAYGQAEFIENGSQILAFNVESQKIEVLDSATGKMLRSFSASNIDYGANAIIGPSGKKLMMPGFETSMYIYDVASGKKISETNKFQKSYDAKLGFVNEDIYYNAVDGMMRWYDVQTHKELLRLYLFLDGEWLAHTPDGRFDGSQEAWKRVVFVKGVASIPLDQVFDVFYTPRILHKILNGEKLDTPEFDIDNLKKAPTVAISFKQANRNLTVEDDVDAISVDAENGTVTVAANGRGATIKEIRLYHNGKRLSNNKRNLVVEDDVPSSGNTKSFEVFLLPGVNQFRAIAVNSESTESAAAELLVDYKPPKQKEVVGGLQTHVLVVGIDEYKNPKYNLNYAVADSDAFKNAIKKGMQTITTNVNLYTINNTEASRETILAKLQEISDKINPQDVFFFYYAGHGVVTQDAAKTFYLVPHDVTQLYGAEDALKQKGISAEELKSIAANIKAQKQMYVLDACQSAGALSTVASRGVAEERAIAQLARSTGTHWLTASGSDQYATEFDELGHGVFTYALLEGLSGKADSGDNRITVNELKAYIESRVPEISEQYKGSPQYPSSFGFGQDFPVGVKQ